jgi:uncharacterized membrane protein
VIEFTNSLLEQVDILLHMQVGDLIRLEYIKKMILDGKPLYSSDKQYVEHLTQKYTNQDYQNIESYTPQPKYDSKCWNCEKLLDSSVIYCPVCGVKQIKQSFEIPSVQHASNNNFNPMNLIGKIGSYQILAIIGGLAALIPILYAASRLDDILYSIGYYTDSDLSGITGIFIFAGVVSSLLCFFVMAVPFVIKNSRKVGRILFFASFAILVTSILTGIVGFVIILIASLVAFKKRRY